MWIIYKDIDLYFIDLLYDANEIDTLKLISLINKKYNLIIKNKLEKFYEFYENDAYIKNINYIFLKSCAFGEIKICKYLIKKDSDTIIKHGEYIYKNAFGISCEKGHIEIAKWIYSLNTIKLDDIISSLGYSCVKGHLEIVKWLYSLYMTNERVKTKVNKKNIDINRIIEVCCINGHLEIINWFYSIYESNGLENTIYINNSFMISCENNHLDVAKWIYPLCKYTTDKEKHDTNSYIFRPVCAKGHLEIAKWLIEVDPYIDINSNNNYALNKSCENDDIKMVKWLCSIGAIITDEIFQISCRSGYIEIVKELILIGNKINKNYDYNKACRMSCMHGQLEIIK